ncbi:MAG: hypothetical protein H7Y06_07850 [Opitutaceae bacterium]|nr:hypothetical protein [Opitutaceae bacterium]
MSFRDSKIAIYFRRVGAGSLFISVAVHAVLIILAITYAITVVREERKVAFRGDGTHNGGPRSPEHRVTMARQQTSLAMATKRLSVDSPSANVSLPDLPDMPSISGGSMGMTGSFGGGGTGGGGPAGGGAGNSMKAPPMPAFGFRQPQKMVLLEGTFYDLKQTPARGAPSDSNLKQILFRIFKDKKPVSTLDAQFFKAPTLLYATQVYIPDMQADEAPAAFGVEKVVKPKNWLAVYRGRVSPPSSGTYSFVGGADDIIAVRLDGLPVLVGGHDFFRIEGDVSASGGKVGSKANPVSGEGLGLQEPRLGVAVDLDASRYYDVEIYIAEIPGGHFGANLFYMKKGETYEVDAPTKRLKLPLFRIADSPVTVIKTLPIMEKGPIWKIRPMSR